MVADPARHRALEMVQLRASGLSLAAIGRRYGLTRQRVAQIVDGAGRVPAAEVARARRVSALDEALLRFDELAVHYRAGLAPIEIARATGLPVRAVRAAIAARATDADRAQRKDAALVPTPSAQFSERQLLAGLRRVARRLGHAPSSGEYAKLAKPLGLGTMPTVYMRFGGWRAALQRAGLEAPSAPARAYGATWHAAACWRALASVADQLGEPPRFRRYVELYAQCDDLPSPATVRARLGLWSQIASQLRGLASGQTPDEVRGELAEVGS